MKIYGFELSKVEQLRHQINKLGVIRTNMVDALDTANDELQGIDIQLQFNTAIAHPSYEIHLIDDLITKLSAELAIESRKEKLEQSV